MKGFTIEQLREMFHYDPETGHIYRRESKRKDIDLTKPSGWKYKGHLYVRIGRSQTAAHRLAWAIHYGEWPKMLDHVDRDRANNRIDNLRIATDSQNQANRGIYGQVNAKGVRLGKNGKSYQAYIKVAQVTKYLGTFKVLDEAAHAYNKAAVQYFGEFALLNPIGADK